MTRIVLCAALAALTLALGLATAVVQSWNREAGQRLNDLREETSLIEAVNGASRAQIIAIDHGPTLRAQRPAPKAARP